MSKRINLLFFAGLFLLPPACRSQADGPADKAASKETVQLYRNLKKLAEKGYLFGHQDDLAYGVEWRYKDGRSDVFETAGDYPGIYGWDLGGIERGTGDVNLDGVPFRKMKQFIRQGYERGAVITLSWHAASPFGAPAGSWDTTKGSVSSVIPGGAHHELYKQWLDNIASFISSLRGSRGELIPVFFRPFHEHTGNWFWWGRAHCTPFEYQTLWRFTYYYLTEEKKLHNLLWVYNTGSEFETEEEFLERYPGDDKTDVLSFDTYQYGDPEKESWFMENTRKKLDLLGKIAARKNKLFALAETGYEAVPYTEWWTKTLVNAIGSNKIAWVLVWRNHGWMADSRKMHYYAPYKGQASVADFIRFYELERTLFEKDVKKENVYQ